MMMKSPLFKDGRKRTSTRRRPPPTLPQLPQTSQDTKCTPATTKATLDWVTMPTETGNTASTANYRITPRMNVSKGSERRNRAEIGKEEPIGLECT
jgi:hypothetical protein